MSAMSASSVKPPLLPSSGVTVAPSVATSPPKVGMIPPPIPSTLTITPTKPANMNHHNNMPLSLIADHKMAPPQFMTQPQTVALPPATQPLPRTPEKPKDFPTPVGPSAKPTSNGMENLASSVSSPPETPVAVTPALKVDTPSVPETTDNKPAVQVSEKIPEPLTTNVARAVEKVETEKKDTTAIVKPTDSANEASKAPSTQVPAQQQQDLPVVPSPSVVPATPTTSTPATVSSSTEQPAVTQSISRTEPTQSKPELKVATIPRQAAKRKREPKVIPTPTPEVKKETKEDDRKSKRVRLPTQPYQSPLPELNIIAKIQKSTKSTPTKAADDKLIVFYKNEFLAVRNAEGGFYVCQAMQNIYKSSPRIRIRWLSQEGGKDTYSPDFYDHTDFDCILTNLNLDKVDKEKFKLPQVEQQRTESILKRALDVEKGVSEKPPVTEEHPDGLDLSLFRDESQIKKSSKGRTRKASTGKKSDSPKSDDDDSSDKDINDEDSEDDTNDDEVTKKEPVSKTSRQKKKSVKKKPPAEKKVAPKTSGTSSKSSVPTTNKKNETRGGNKRKASVSSSSPVAEKRSRTQPSERTNKTRSAEVTVGVKSQRDRRAKSRK